MNQEMYQLYIRPALRGGVITKQDHKSTTLCGNKSFIWGERTYVMGAINVTPDSFSGDGLGYDVEGAVRRAQQMEEEGADLIDVGGESTRRYNNLPAAEPIGAEEELRRVLPAIKGLSKVLNIPISIDTYKAEVARRCVDSGADMVNYIWGTEADPEMLEAVVEMGVPVVLMHNKLGHRYQDLIPEIVEDLRAAAGRASKAGISREKIVVDPGLGFGKTADQSLEIERRLSEFQTLGLPLLVGPSRKSHIGLVLGGLPPDQRLEGTAATVALCIAGGADIVRVHDVKEMVRVARMSDAIVRGWRPTDWA